jgi:hypothetical protein
MPLFAFLKIISPRGWLAIGLAVVVLAFVAMGSSLMRANSKIATLTSDLHDCSDNAKKLENQIKDTAVEEGKRYEAVEAQWRAQCGAAYDAGAKRLRDDQAVAAGRYMPKPRPSTPGR